MYVESRVFSMAFFTSPLILTAMGYLGEVGEEQIEPRLGGMLSRK